MTLTEKCAADLLATANAYAAARGVTLASVGSYAANDSKFFIKIRDGARGFTVARFEATMAWFAANWPFGVTWPAGVRRPPRRPAAGGVDGAGSAKA